MIIGSTAMHLQGYDIIPKDLDLMCKGVTVQCAYPSDTLVESHWFGEASEYIMKKNYNPVFIDAPLLLTLKCSHFSWNIKWLKTRSHILLLKERHQIDPTLYELLYTHWETVHGVKNFSMKMSNDEFFSDAVKRKYEHDELHEIVAYPKQPINEHFRVTMDSPLYDTDKWSHADHDKQLRSAEEEIAVIALERWLLKLDVVRKSDINIAVTNAYKQLVTTMTKGTFNRFLIFNIESLTYKNGVIISLINNALKRINHE